jgi:hypothetical protein
MKKLYRQLRLNRGGLIVLKTHVKSWTPGTQGPYTRSTDWVRGQTVLLLDVVESDDDLDPDQISYSYYAWFDGSGEDMVSAFVRVFSEGRSIWLKVTRGDFEIISSPMCSPSRSELKDSHREGRHESR